MYRSSLSVVVDVAGTTYPQPLQSVTDGCDQLFDRPPWLCCNQRFCRNLRLLSQWWNLTALDLLSAVDGLLVTLHNIVFKFGLSAYHAWWSV